MDIMLWLTETTLGEMCFTGLISMLPVLELRGGLPFGVSLGLAWQLAFFASVVGNLIPVPFIVVYIRRILQYLRRHFDKLDILVTKLEARAHLKGKLVTKYRFWGLCILVAIPLPGTGAWTGALVAAFLDMRLREAIPAITLGVLIAGVVVLIFTLGVLSFT